MMARRSRWAVLLPLFFVAISVWRWYGAEMPLEEALDKTKLKIPARREGRNYTVAIVAMYMNEAQYLMEWIAHHVNVGVSHFYLYDHGSRDDHLDLLKPLEERGLVTLIDARQLFLGKGRKTVLRNQPVTQLIVLTHWWNAWRHEVDWVVCIDVDEFLYVEQGGMVEFLGGMRRGVGGVAMNRVPFSTDGRVERIGRDELAIKAFGERVRKDKLEKEGGKIAYRVELMERMIRELHRFDGSRGVLVDVEGRVCGERNESAWAGFNVERVEEPVFIAHFLTRSLRACWKKQRDSGKVSGAWRHRMPRSYCEKWHSSSRKYLEGRYERWKGWGERVEEVCGMMWKLGEEYCRRWHCCERYGLARNER